MIAERGDLHNSKAIADSIQLHETIVIIQQDVPHMYHTHKPMDATWRYKKNGHAVASHGGINRRVTRTVAQHTKLALWRMNVYWQTAIQLHV